MELLLISRHGCCGSNAGCGCALAAAVLEMAHLPAGRLSHKRRQAQSRLNGLAVSVATMGLLYIDACPPITVWALEEILEFLGIWLTLVAILGHFSNVSPPQNA